MGPLRLLLLTILVLTPIFVTSKDADSVAEDFLTIVNDRLARLYNNQVEYNWQQEITSSDQQSQDDNDPIYETMDYIKSIAAQVSKLKRAKITNPDLVRLLHQIPDPGYDALDDGDQRQLHDVVANMSEIYKNVGLCSYREPSVCNLRLIPEVQEIIQDSRDVEEIKYYWLEWREKTGLRTRNSFKKFTDLYKKTAELNGYKSASDFWLKDIEGSSEQIMATLDGIITGLKPLFLQFHAFVRSTLRLRYGPEQIKHLLPYPQHLAEIFIGNSFRDMNGEWKLDLPYPDIGLPNITAGLMRNGINNPELLFRTVANHFISLGFPPISGSFWSESARPKADVDERLMTCWHKTWKFYHSKRINLSYCPNVDEERYTNMFEALSDYYYYRSYQHLPTLYQEEPLPNFSDAIGKAFTLSATSPRFLEKIGIVDARFKTYEARINRLYLHGLRNVFLIPIFYVLDKYRLDILDDKIKNLDNCAYWALTERYTGASPPVQRSSGEFDAPSKLLVEVDDQYSSPIMSIILQFQIFKSFCERTGQYRKGDPQYPLDLCDLSGQKNIGSILLNGMSLGSSKSWREVLYAMTGEGDLDITGFLEFFSPLYSWLESINKVNHEEIGWHESKQCV